MRSGTSSAVPRREGDPVRDRGCQVEEGPREQRTEVGSGNGADP